MKKSYNGESGNALWFILIAIALLTALTLTITRSSDTTEQSGDIERARIYVSDLMRFAADVAKAVDRMRLNGISENEISFDGVAALPGYANGTCTENACKVFVNGGGAIAYKSPIDSLTTQEWLFTGANTLSGVGNSASNDLVMILSGLSKQICAQINTELGLGTVNSASTSFTQTKFDGTFPDSPVEIDAYSRVKAGCFTDLDEGYHFYQVLIAR